jgi:signal transduction histidine kinase
MVTDQLAGTADRAQQLERLQTANERLERENAELRRRLGEAEVARGRASRFLLNVSHELGAPLTAIRGHADLLAGDPGGRLSLQQHAMVERIGQAAAMLLRLTGNLLDLSRLRLGQTGLEEAPQEAGALAERALAAAGPVPEAVRFRLERPDGAVPLVADGDKIVTILDNLLSNAFHFTARGEVVLTVRRTPLIVPAEGRHAVVEWEVRDSGIGIRDEELTSIFDELRQVDGSSTRLYGGTGLGLSLSRGLARLLGGEITVQSQQSSGSTFTFRLPARVS